MNIILIFLYNKNNKVEEMKRKILKSIVLL